MKTVAVTALLCASAAAFAPQATRQSQTVLAAENNPNPFGTPSLDLGGTYVGGWTPPSQQSSFNGGPPPFGSFGSTAAPAAAPAVPDYSDNPYASAVLGGASPAPAPVSFGGGWKPAPLGPKPLKKSNPNHVFDPMRYINAARPAW
eukprot:CAMPEP_0116553746 /NCGR_PEP_ID=MMETSP0397-20121206/7214_1 /TAXON_ID=216820 /ORGANISM="Cyclophora tenuis, Strain ECT3854" /LENGTH=145 /DNA_ID=CAMNT_0004078843 /DNA_START=25 /DNA_END=462 /DNA_ORIENTATION=+